MTYPSKVKIGDNVNTCQDCQNGDEKLYKVECSRCLQKKECDECSKDITKCDKCSDGYYIRNGVCYKNCPKQSKKSLVPGTQQCVDCSPVDKLQIANCKDCSDKYCKTCITDEEGPQAQEICTQCMDDYGPYTNPKGQQVCTKCFFLFETMTTKQLQEFQNSLTAKKVKRIIQQISQQQQTQKLPYTIVKTEGDMTTIKTCVICQALNCLECDKTGSTCTKCAIGHFLNTTTTRELPKPRCEMCSRDLVYGNKELKIEPNPSCIQCKDQNCQNCYQNESICVKCFPDYVLYNGQCLEECPRNMYANPDKTDCLQCKAGDFSKIGECARCLQRECAQCEKNINNCIICQNDYLLKDGKCINHCESKLQYFEKGKCYDCPKICTEGCLTWSECKNTQKNTFEQRFNILYDEEDNTGGKIAFGVYAGISFIALLGILIYLYKLRQQEDDVRNLLRKINGQNIVIGNDYQSINQINSKNQLQVEDNSKKKNKVKFTGPSNLKVDSTKKDSHNQNDVQSQDLVSNLDYKKDNEDHHVKFDVKDDFNNNKNNNVQPAPVNQPQTLNNINNNQQVEDDSPQRLFQRRNNPNTLNVIEDKDQNKDDQQNQQLFNRRQKKKPVKMQQETNNNILD